MASRDERVRRERIRENIRAFYDVKPTTADTPPPATQTATAAIGETKPGTQPTTVSKPEEGAAMNIDSREFDAVEYTSKLLKNKSLAGLVEADNGLRRQVKALDGELQSLVYSNYTGFLSATDTIRQVRTNVADMDARLGALSDSVASMDRVSHALTTDLETHRTRIEGVLAVNTVLRKVQFLVRLPEVLQRALRVGRLVDGARYWVSGDAVLANYDTLPAFRRTREASRIAAEELYVSISRRILENIAGRSETAAADAEDTTTASLLDAMCRMHQTTIDKQKLQEQGAIVVTTTTSDDDDPSSAVPAIAAAVYEHARSLALKRFDASVENTVNTLVEGVARTDSEVRTTIAAALAEEVDATATQGNTLAHCTAQLKILVDDVSVTLDSTDGATTPVLASLQTASVELRATLAKAAALTKAEADAAAAAMGAAQAALDRILTAFNGAVVHHLPRVALHIARGVARVVAGAFVEMHACLASTATMATTDPTQTSQEKAVERTSKPSSSPWLEDGVKRLQAAWLRYASCLVGTVCKNLAGIASEALRTPQLNHVLQFQSYIATSAVNTIQQVAGALRALCADPLDLVDALQLQQQHHHHHQHRTDEVSRWRKGETASVGLWPGALAVACLVRTLSVGVLPGLSGFLPSSVASVVPPSDHGIEEAGRSIVYAAITVGGAAITDILAEGMACAARVPPAAAAEVTSAVVVVDAPSATFGVSSRVCFEWLADVVCATVDAHVTAAAPSSSATRAANRRQANAAASERSRGSGDSKGYSAFSGRGSRGGAAATTSAEGQMRTRAADLFRVEVLAAPRAAQHLRRDSVSYVSDVDKLFSRPTGAALVLKPSTLDRAHVFECAAAYILQGLTDAARQTLDPPSGATFHQLQVDATALLSVLAAHSHVFSRKPDRLASLVDELAATVYDRAADRTPLPEDRVVSIATLWP